MAGKPFTEAPKSARPGRMQRALAEAAEQQAAAAKVLKVLRRPAPDLPQGFAAERAGGSA